MSRRDAVKYLSLLGSAAVVGACQPKEPTAFVDNSPRIEPRPGTPTRTIAAGLHTVDVQGLALGQLYVPPGYVANLAAPMFVLFHGAGRRANELMEVIRPLAESRGIVLLALDSFAETWDYIYGPLGLDVNRLNLSLAWTFERCNIDALRISCVGFSDGGTYVLALGRRNGDFFRSVVAFSPGFVRNDLTPIGLPSFFITHGIDDQILNIDATSRVIVPALRNAGYSVTYREFLGGHGVTPALLEEAVNWAAAQA